MAYSAPQEDPNRRYLTPKIAGPATFHNGEGWFYQSLSFSYQHRLGRRFGAKISPLVVEPRPATSFPSSHPLKGIAALTPPQHAGHFALPCSLPSPLKTGSHPVTPCQAKALRVQQASPKSLTTSTASWSVTRANRKPRRQPQCPGLYACSGKGFPCCHRLRGGDKKSPSRCRVRS